MLEGQASHKQRQRDAQRRKEHEAATAVQSLYRRGRAQQRVQALKHQRLVEEDRRERQRFVDAQRQQKESTLMALEDHSSTRLRRIYQRQNIAELKQQEALAVEEKKLWQVS